MGRNTKYNFNQGKIFWGVVLELIFCVVFISIGFLFSLLF